MTTACDDDEMEGCEPSTETKIKEALAELSNMISEKNSSKCKELFDRLTGLICENVNKYRNEIRSNILTNYTDKTLKLIDYLNEESKLPSTLGSKSRELNEILVTLLSIPGFIYNLNKYSSETLKKLNESTIFELCLKSLTSDLDLQGLTSSSSICLLANLVHLASLNEQVLTKETTAFVTLAAKLLESSRKNMLQLPSSLGRSSDKSRAAISVGSNDKKKKNDMNVFFNPILGWLAREEATTIDKDILKTQLSNLWGVRMLKILLQDLVKANDGSSSARHAQQQAQASSKSRGFSFIRRISADNGQQSETKVVANSGDSSLQAGIFRRAVERAANTVSRTMYVKTTGSNGSSGSSKLMTNEAHRIALVCFMLHSTINTLTTLKQDILTALCLQDYILPNLWKYISSLGPQNGLKAFLEHLAIHTKTSAPEFHILTLFCECSSHLISILDDSELYEQQKPFSIEDLLHISSFLNLFVYRVLNENLIPCGTQDADPILRTTHKLLTDLYKRDCRRKFTPKDHWLVKEIKMSLFLKELEAQKPTAQTILSMIPHAIAHKERVLIFRRLIAKDRAQHSSASPSTFITINRSRIVEDGYQQLIRLPSHALKGLIRVKFVNDFGLDEAGIDQDGVFKEFLEDSIKRVFDPAMNLFCSTSEQRLYPSPTSRLHENYLSLFTFVGKMLGKAIYEGIVVDVPFATFFLSRVLGQPQSPLYSPIDELPSLDPELYKSLTYIKHYEGDVSELDLTFSIDQDFMGKIETYELEPGGKSIPVTRESRVRYIHSVAHFRMKTQIEQQTEAFVNGFKSIIDLRWLNMFSAPEFQRLISGDNTPVDLQDLRRNTKYFGGFHNNHRVVCWLWDILEKDFTAEEHRLFLKFVTSCSKPPLLGFAHLEPPFSIRCVEVSDDQDLGDTVGSVLRGFFAIRRSDPVDRLPTSSTCFNLLKLPNYQRRSTLREKLRYAIKSNPGFELS